jgi:hypothetical protein
MQKICSWKPDTNAMFVDAFSKTWKDTNLYAFPPSNLVNRCPHKTALDEAGGVLIVPIWQTQPWSPRLLRRLMTEPVILPLDVLQQSFNSIRHPLRKPLRLLTCRFSGASMYKPKGIAERAINIILASWRHSTNNRYLSYIKSWRNYCTIRKINPLCPNETVVVQLFAELFEAGLEYSAMNTARLY